MHTDLDRSDFYVHAHDLPLSKMTRPMAEFIGNQIGVFRDMDMDENGGSWGASLRIRVSLNLNQPLPCVLKIRTPLGDEQLISFTMERLPNFFYICGCLGHLSKFCPSRFEEGFEDPGDNTPYGHGCERRTIHHPETAPPIHLGPNLYKPTTDPPSYPRHPTTIKPMPEANVEVLISSMSGPIILGYL
ncbi:UNVERIFIED_CONTAM: hypothetical protein Slati_1325300 [Sesamum latifolium]|uniref:Zinc knuckle CX2CX4HX4C domain-containing protein n=1 Tax=Sesamum latifolium TaxID=2727402 RepID=A0AAW2XHH2_9LAMI